MFHHQVIIFTFSIWFFYTQHYGCWYFYSHTYKKDPHYDTLEQRLRLIICIGCSKASLISLYLQTSAMKNPQKQTKNNFILYILSYLQDICKMKR